MWAGKEEIYAPLIATQSDLQERLYKRLPDSTITPDSLCSDEFVSRGQLMLSNRIDLIERKLMTALAGETANLNKWTEKFDHAKASNAPYDTQLSAYDKMMWSSARNRMLVPVVKAFHAEATFHRKKFQNSCALARILALEPYKWADKEQLQKLKLTLDQGSEQKREEIRTIYETTVNTILSMP